jgi:Protein of unknown function (DUF3810)
MPLGRLKALARIGFLSLFLLAAFVSLLPLPSSLMERLYTRGLYRFIAAVVVPITAWFPFSLSLAALLVLPFGLTFALWRWKRNKTRFTWRAAARGLLVLVAGYGAFQLIWGFNYRREPVETLLELPAARVTPPDLERLARGLLDIVQKNADAPRDRDAAFRSLQDALRTTVATTTGQVPTLPMGVKSPPAGWLLGIRTSGVISPLTLEAHVDAGLPEPFFLAVAAHELAHLTGFAGEADTDLIAAVSGLNATDPYARYAVALNSFSSVYAELPVTTRASLDRLIPTRARADYRAYSAALKRYELPDAITRLTQGAYNGYLQSQGVSAGIRDYSRVVTLLAKWWRKQGR